MLLGTADGVREKAAYRRPVLTLGVDLAAADERTASAVVRWRDGEADVVEARLGVGDEAILEAIPRVDRAGIDCPFGWPVPFTEMVAGHARGRIARPGPEESSAQWRRRMVYRTTDEVVRAETGLIPLSVSADRIAHAAFRAALLLTRLAEAGIPVDRTGDGPVAEVYPAACLRRWGLAHRGYKRGEGHGFLVDHLLAAAPWLRFGEHEQLLRMSHDAFDAVIAALAARAVALGRFRRPGADERPSAVVEGWIALPTCDLSELIRS
jgi:predicted nuclease with RNAse H fold